MASSPLKSLGTLLIVTFRVAMALIEYEVFDFAGRLCSTSSGFSCLQKHPRFHSVSTDDLDEVRGLCLYRPQPTNSRYLIKDAPSCRFSVPARKEHCWRICRNQLRYILKKVISSSRKFHRRILILLRGMWVVPISVGLPKEEIL